MPSWSHCKKAHGVVTSQQLTQTQRKKGGKGSSTTVFAL